MGERALSFGAAAAAYERFRPGYPDALVDAVLAYSDRPLRTALEIGAGTGKATRVLAAHGIAVTATEPDPAMLAELRRQVPASVTPVQAALEDLAASPTHDLVLAAASLHWTEPTGRWPRVAAQLAPGGVFASVGGPVRLADDDLEAALVTARSPYLATDELPSPDGTPPHAVLQWPGTELTASPLFTDMRQVTVPRRTTMSAPDFVGHLSTVSAYLELAAPARSAALEAVLGVLPERVDVVADLTLHLARLAPSGLDSV